MAMAKLTNWGEVVIPVEIRSWLHLEPGDSIDFVIGEDGKVYVQPAKGDVRELSGMLYEPGIKAVSLEEMEAGICDCVGESA